MEARVLALDGGRSGCRARARLPTGEASESAGPPLPYVRGKEAPTRIASSLEGALVGLAVSRAEVVVAGLAGIFQHPEVAAPVAAALAERTAARRVVVTGDLVTSYAGALGLEVGTRRLDPGVVVAAGTGAVAFAVGPAGDTASADGWGYLLGDEGGGYWIGRAGLAAALAHRDGRGGSAALLARAEARFGPVERLPDLVYGTDAPSGLIATFAHEVAAAVDDDGDGVAADIWQEAGRLLGRTAAAAAAVLDGGHGSASYTGGLFASGPLLVEPFRAELARRCPDLELRSPAGSALDGAELLAELDPFPSSLGHVHVAGR
jgi:N-acetylglucosamine kinase-like BadF-type ATPase